MSRVNNRLRWMSLNPSNDAAGEAMLEDNRETLLDSTRTRMEQIEDYAYSVEPFVEFETDSEAEYYAFIKRELQLGD